MSANTATRILAGVMLSASLVLASLVDLRWLWLTAFVGANLTQFALSGFCPAVLVFGALGLKAECPSRAMTVHCPPKPELDTPRYPSTVTFVGRLGTTGRKASAHDGLKRGAGARLRDRPPRM